MSENDVKAIALFFFFAFLDEGKAIEATTEAVENCRHRISKKANTKTSVALVAASKQVWDKNKKRVIRGRSNYHAESGWLLEKGIDMGSWKEFQKSVQEEELLSLIWSQILRISDEDISLGLGISVGTLRYRVGRALRKLGSLTHPIHQEMTKKSSLGIVKS